MTGKNITDRSVRRTGNTSCSNTGSSSTKTFNARRGHKSSIRNMTGKTSNAVRRHMNAQADNGQPSLADCEHGSAVIPNSEETNKSKQLAIPGAKVPKKAHHNVGQAMRNMQTPFTPQNNVVTLEKLEK
ncbi:hypothetical protein BaRGS_00037399, partial [Batillaria attramentaria]